VQRIVCLRSQIALRMARLTAERCLVTGSHTERRRAEAMHYLLLADIPRL